MFIIESFVFRFLSQKCRTANCKNIRCTIGRLKEKGSREITVETRLRQNTFIARKVCSGIILCIFFYLPSFPQQYAGNFKTLLINL